MNLTPLELQCRFGGQPLTFQVVCPQNGTAVLKRVKSQDPTLQSSNRGLAFSPHCLARSACQKRLCSSFLLRNRKGVLRSFFSACLFQEGSKVKVASNRTFFFLEKRIWARLRRAPSENCVEASYDRGRPLTFSEARMSPPRCGAEFDGD